MNQEDVQKLSNAANAKITLLKNDFFKYFMRAIMAGFFIVVAMIFSNVVGNVFSGAEEPAWGKFLGALVFSIAVLLISLVGGELFTGNNLVMAFGAFDKKISWGDAAKVWVVSYIGNFVGCLILSLIFLSETNLRSRQVRCFSVQFCVTSLYVLGFFVALSLRAKLQSF